MEQWWRDLNLKYEFEAHHLTLLETAARLDEMTAAAAVLVAQGMIYQDKKGCLHRRPEVSIERDARTALMRALSELKLDGGDVEPREPSATN
jgi:phage terminase small subunit